MAKPKKKSTTTKKVDVVKDIDTEEEVDEIEEEFEEVEEIEEEEFVVDEEDDDDSEDDDTEDEEEEEEDISLDERIANIEKKTNYTFILVIVTLVVACLTLLVSINSKGTGTEAEETDTTTQQTDSSQTSYTYDTSKFKAIKASEIKSASKSETIVVLIARQGCSYCSYFAPIITEVAEDYGITIRYIDLATIVDFSQALITDEEAYDTLAGLEGSGDWEGFAKKNITGTPLTLIIKNNKVVGGIAGYVKASGVESAFEDAGLKK